MYKMFWVLLPISEVPDGMTVTKRTGKKEYTLKSSIKIHGNLKDKISTQEIKAESGTRFLVASEGGGINAVSETMEVLVQMNQNGLLALGRDKSLFDNPCD